ncbi:FtsX-like permease family protein [Cellulomonas sp. S1-8]|uniref:FtsX-like permease family protein n=1 Tax=Cellulomonas sp. S1-8 TaxID=2904790 RepID=UPI002243DD88|nr:FtsX-like permease family protein [Cellulomonas sp. S1-8]UZN04358.1 hypothetical protein OKX07_05360 [Cellulomonas sp. S1-8]
MSALATRVRATTADAPLVTRRRARQDAGLLLGTAILLVATLIAMLAAPRLLARTADEALREAITNAGTDAAVVVPRPQDPYFPAPPLDAALTEAQWLDRMLEGLHPATAIAPSGTVTATLGEDQFMTRLVTLATPADPAEPVRWTTGRAPAVIEEQVYAGSPYSFSGTLFDTSRSYAVEVGLSVDAARTLGIDPTAGPVSVALAVGRLTHEARVTGLYEPVDPADPRWTTVPDLLGAVRAEPQQRAATSAALYVPTDARPDMWRVAHSPAILAEAVALVDADDLTVAEAHELRRSLRAQAVVLPDLTSGLPDIVDAFDAHADATRAQASLVIAGVGAAAACCLLLAAGLLVERRRTFLSGERARGASLGSVALRGAMESVPTALGAAVVAGVVVHRWLPDRSASLWLPAAVAAVAAVAPAVLAARAAGVAWGGRRVPIDRRERSRVTGLRRARHLVVEVAVVTVAVVALVSLRGRGLVPGASSQADPLLLVTPFLLALAAAVVVVRIAPVVVRVAARWAVRSRGLAAPLAATRAQRTATSLLPVVAVTVAVALMVLSGVLVQNVQDGQRLAADRLVGADVRLDGALATPEAAQALEALAAAPGVDAVATGMQLVDRTYGRGTGLTASVLVVDTAALAEVRAARGLEVDPGLAGLGEASDGAVPALVSADLLARADTADGGLVQILSDTVELDVRGATTLVADGGAPPVDVRAAHVTTTADDGLVVVDRAAVTAAARRLPDTSVAWVSGPGAAQAVADAGFAELPGVTVTTVDGWWRAWSQAPLPSALTALLLAAVGALALLAVVALVLVVVATSGERGRTLSTLRTIGLDARTARWATLGELAPLVLGGLVGGTAIGLALPLLVGDALGLQWVTAAPGDVPVTLAWWPVLLAAGALVVALVVAVTVEQAVRRRQRLGEVLRVGAR